MMAHLNVPVLALVPARGGSRGVPRKNLAPVGGRPLVAHTLDAALQSTVVDHTYVSSDDEEILEVGRRAGATALLRPDGAASDAATAMDVVRHFIQQIPADVRQRDPYIVYLQPTSPLRTASHVDGAFRALGDARASTLVSVVPLAASPFKSFTIDGTGRLESLFDETMSNARRQDLPTAYVPNGAIYVFRVSDFTARGGFPSNGSVPFVMDDAASIDVDSADDLTEVERAMKARPGEARRG